MYFLTQFGVFCFAFGRRITEDPPSQIFEELANFEGDVEKPQESDVDDLANRLAKASCSDPTNVPLILFLLQSDSNIHYYYFKTHLSEKRSIFTHTQFLNLSEHA